PSSTASLRSEGPKLSGSRDQCHQRPTATLWSICATKPMRATSIFFNRSFWLLADQVGMRYGTGGFLDRQVASGATDKGAKSRMARGMFRDVPAQFSYSPATCQAAVRPRHVRMGGQCSLTPSILTNTCREFLLRCEVSTL
ncbi:hypothetical protein, partial [Novosphingobium indicum]|uniref:hypothetical protein n=1 Tax=Novosphingobium indicum TaxID=462949 RepID=UPI001E49733B